MPVVFYHSVIHGLGFFICQIKRLAWKNSRHFVIQSEVKLKSILTRPHTFSRPLRRLHVCCGMTQLSHFLTLGCRISNHNTAIIFREYFSDLWMQKWSVSFVFDRWEQKDPFETLKATPTFNVMVKNTDLACCVNNKYGLLTKCEVKMAGYWPSSFFACLWTETESTSINMQKKKKERGQYSVILTEKAWSIKDLLYGFRGNFSCGTRRVVPSGQGSSILPARVANQRRIWFILPAHGASHIIMYDTFRVWIYLV